MPENKGSPPRPSARALIAWCSYDWANSAFPTVVATFVFSAYFVRAVAVDEVTGTAQWGYAMSLSAILMAVTAPVFGAIADHGGRRKPWILAFTLLCVVTSSLLWFAAPDPAYILFALAVVVIANFAFETGIVFYNAMLPELAPPSMVGRVSGWAWGLGYFGGLSCLALALVGFVQPETPWFGLDREAAEHVRATALIVSVWFAVFSIPFFLFTPDSPATGIGGMEAVRRGVSTLIGTLRQIRRYADIARFLLARMIYTDGLNTLFAFGGAYAAGTFGMDYDEIILFAIAINVTAGLGAAAFAWIDDWIGPKLTILISLAALTVLGTALCFVESKALFWALGLPLGIFIGPTQSASRSLMARAAPPALRAEMFGLYAFSGKVTAFLGPALLGWVTVAMDSQRWGMATILIFLVLGALLLLPVPDPARSRE